MTAVSVVDFTTYKHKVIILNMNREFGPVDLAGIHIESPIMNGAGPVKLPEHVLEVAKSAASAIVLGSITIEERQGNEGITYYDGANFSLNSKGLPNPGLAYYEKHLPVMVRIAHDHGKPLFVSVAGFSPEETARLARAVVESGADGSELNFGCPNVWGKDGKQKRVTSFDLDLTGDTLSKVEKEIGTDGWVAVKLSYFSDSHALEQSAELLGASKLVKAVTSTNTIPNSFSFNEKGEPAIDPGGGLAGMGGPAIKIMGLGQVAQLSRVLPSGIAVIGVGGISTNRDAGDYLATGARAVQITTAYINFGPWIFKRVREQTT